MNKLTQVAGVVALGLFTLVLILWWQQAGLSGEIARLRSQMETAPEPSAPAPIARPSMDPLEARPARTTGNLPLDARVAELEMVVNAQADAIEELQARLDGMEANARKVAAPPWSAAQAIGSPDSAAGDQRTAWASATADGGEEWLQVDFAQEVEAVAVIVRENCAPGAIIRISAVMDAGNEVPIWQGEAPQVAAVSETPFGVRAGILTKRVKIYLDTRKVSGWNEIDAVQLVGRDGSRQWATGAQASSSYGAGSQAQRAQGALQLGTGGAMAVQEQDSKREAVRVSGLLIEPSFLRTPPIRGVSMDTLGRQ